MEVSDDRHFLVPGPVIAAMLAAPVAGAAVPAVAPAPAAAPVVAAPAAVAPAAPASAAVAPAVTAPAAAAAPAAAPAPAERVLPRLSIAHELAWKGAKTSDCVGALALTIEGFEFKPSGDCTETAHVPWTSVKRYCFIPSRILGDAQLSFVVQGSRGWLFVETSKASKDELSSLVEMLRTSSIPVRESCE